MSPAQAKQKQHERYEAVAVQVLRGRAGYKPAVKSRFSKSANSNSPILSLLPDPEL